MNSIEGEANFVSDLKRDGSATHDILTASEKNNFEINESLRSFRRSESDMKIMELESLPTKDWETYFKKRWHLSNIKRYYSGDGLEMEDADTVMNTLSMVNALLLTIPFSIINGLGNEFWDWLELSIADCEDSQYHSTAENLVLPLYLAVFCTILSLIIAVMYYFLRPRKHFLIWWKFRGKWSVATTMLTTAIAVLVILILFSTLMGWFVTSSDSLCVTVDVNKRRYSAAYTLISIMTVGLGLVMV
jgi:hypothetical protein